MTKPRHPRATPTPAQAAALRVLQAAPNGLHCAAIADTLERAPQRVNCLLHALRMMESAVALPDPIPTSRYRMRWCVAEHVDTTRAAIAQDRQARAKRGRTERPLATFATVASAAEPVGAVAVARDAERPMGTFEALGIGRYLGDEGRPTAAARRGQRT